MTPSPALIPFTRQPNVVRLSILLLALLTVALSALLWPHWLHNPDLSHGLFMPVIFILLLRESRQGSGRFLDAGPGSTVATIASLFVGLLTLAAGGLYAASLGWSHDLVGFTLTVALVVLMGAGWIVCAQDSIRLIPFNWSALVAIGLWLLCAPLPPGTYTRFTLGLQLMVTENVLRALHLLGIGAVRHGNILELASTSVGIEEACSGVRSLISCVFAALFFSASLVRRPWSRVVIIVLSAPLALVMNFVRSLTLTLLANSGVPIAGRWHDLTGFGVLAVTAALLAGLALLLEPRGMGLPTRDGLNAAASPRRGADLLHPGSNQPDSTGTDVAASKAFITAQETHSTPGRLSSARLLVSGLTLAVLLTLFFYVNTHSSPQHNAPVPDLAAVLPVNADGWRVDTATDLYQFSDRLQTDHLAQRTYSRTTERGPEQITVYLAYWRPGQASVSLVASHTPDACWPGAGWESVPVPHPRTQLDLAGRSLPEAEARSFVSGEYPQNVWFWHLYNGHPITQKTPNSPSQLLRLAWRYGFRHDGDQLFVRVSSNRSWNDISREPFLATLFARLQPLGL